jgi:hypothetical protein
MNCRRNHLARTSFQHLKRCNTIQISTEAKGGMDAEHLRLGLRNTWRNVDTKRAFIHHDASSRDKGGQKEPPLSLFLTPFAPWWARDRLSSILALGQILRRLSSQRSPILLPPPSTASNNPKMAPLYFCRFGRKLMLVEDADLYKQARPRGTAGLWSIETRPPGTASSPSTARTSCRSLRR